MALIPLVRPGVALFVALLGSGAPSLARHAQPAPADSPTVIVAGDQRERTLSSGETHAYAIDLARDDYVHLVVTPAGIDVAASLARPDGTALDADMTSEAIGPESVFAIAEQGGQHRVLVKATSANAPPGRYSIRVEALRAATPEDVIRVRGRRVLETGERLTRTGDANAWRQATSLFVEARTLFQSVADAHNEAMAAYESAGNAADLASPDALDLSLDALRRFRALGDDFQVARTMTIVGLTYIRRGELDEALGVFRDALALHQRLGNVGQEAVVYNNLGMIHGRRGEPERAVEVFQTAYQVAERMGLDRGLAMTLNNLAIASKDLGDFRLSRSYYEKALGMVRGAKNPNLEAVLFTNLGNLHRKMGDYTEALAAYEAGLVLARAAGTRESEARVLNTIGSLLYQLGDYQKALEHHEQSLAMRRTIVDVTAEAASLNGAGLALHRLGESDRAITQLTEALAIRRRTSDRLGEAQTLRDLALVERDRAHLTAARGHLEAALELTDMLRGQIMSPDLRASFIAAEHDRYELYVDVLMQLYAQQPEGRLDITALEASERGRARVLRESLIEARTDIRAGIAPALLERERALQREIESASARLSRLLTRTSDPTDVETARQALSGVMTQYGQLQAQIRRESPSYAALTQPPPLAVADLQRDLVDRDTILLEYSLGEKRSWLWAVTTTDVTSFELPPRREIEDVGRRVYELLTARQPRSGESVTARNARVARADADLRRETLALSGMILAPVATHFGAAWRGRRLLIVASEMLQFLPFSALSEPAGDSQPLVIGHEVAYLPSASVLSTIRTHAARQAPAARQLAVVADPVFDAEDSRIAGGARPEAERARSLTRGTSDAPGVSVEARALRSVEGAGQSPMPRLTRLPFTRQEARAIAALVPAGQRLEATDFRASRATVLAPELADYRFVHLATHGFFNSEQPELSGLVFSLLDRSGKPQDGFLRLSDIYNMRLSADVVVLSACQTALGKDIRGEGLVGLTRGFLYAGARRVVASLWQVDDLATAELMRRFYRGMILDGLRPAEALHRAQQQLARDPRWSSPFFWSAFVLQGDWQ